MKTKAEAETKWCLAETEGKCISDRCMAWRWETITTAHPMWADAVRAKAAELDEKPPFAKAARWVSENKADLGMVPTRGYCGIAGEPK